MDKKKFLIYFLITGLLIVGVVSAFTTDISDETSTFNRINSTHIYLVNGTNNVKITLNGTTGHIWAQSINVSDWSNVSITESQVRDADWWDADGDISADEISESKINFVTACASGNHYYLNGNDLACEADADTTYSCSDWAACSDDSLWDADKLDGQDGTYYLDDKNCSVADSCASILYLGDADKNCSADLSCDSTILYESELNTFSELDAQIADATLLQGGTLTDTYWCFWDNTNSKINCTQAPYTDFGSSIDDTEMTNEDFGDFTCTGNEDGCTVDKNYNTSTEIAKVKVDNATHSDHSSEAYDTSCTGDTEYLDGTGSCDDISGVYLGITDQRYNDTGINTSTNINNLFTDDLTVDDNTNNCSIANSCEHIVYGSNTTNWDKDGSDDVASTWAMDRFVNVSWTNYTLDTEIINNCSATDSCPNILYLGDADKNCSADVSCGLITYDSELAYINNCSVDNSCGLITYDSELAYIENCSVTDSCTNILYLGDADKNCSAQDSCSLIAYNTELINNCSASDSCANIIYETELDDESELEGQLTDVSDVYTNNDGSLMKNLTDTNQTNAWFNKIYVYDAFTSYLATGTAPFTIASTTQVANLNSSASAVSYDLVCTDCIGTTEISDSYLLKDGDSVDGTLAFGNNPFTITSKAKIDNLNCSYAREAYDTSCTGDTEYLDGTGNCDDISGVYVQASDWTTIDNYPTGCTNQFVTDIDDTLTCTSVDSAYIATDAVKDDEIDYTAVTLADFTNDIKAITNTSDGIVGILNASDRIYTNHLNASENNFTFHINGAKLMLTYNGSHFGWE